MDVNLTITTSFEKHYKSKAKIVIAQGGGRSGKTYSILQILILTALMNENKVISVVAENIPFLKRGALRDFKDIMVNAGLWNDKNFNKTDFQYKFPSGSIIEFFSVENPGRALGSARDILFINEANHVHYETAFQLMARTRERIYLDYNPTAEFWVHEEIIGNKHFEQSYELIKTTYKDNEHLTQSIIDTMLARGMKDKNYKKVYIDGEVGTAEGVILPNFKLIDEIPDEIVNRARQQYLSLDFGYSGDPASICSVYVVGSNKDPIQEVYVDEVAFQSGLSNKQLTKIIKQNIEKTAYTVVADSSEPKSIDEIFSYGIHIEGVVKPAGSINYGINLLKGADIYITSKSINTIKEFRNYKWATDRFGRPQKDSKGRPVPVDLWNHSIDGIRYVCMFVNDKRFNYRDVPRGGATKKGLIPV